jgi:pimeloyl-ACP methyl ester carboxylesterase
MAPHVMVEELSVQSIAQARSEFEKQGLRDRLQRYHKDVDAAFWQWNDIWLSPRFRSFDIRGECRRITAPLLAMQGSDDAYGSPAQVESIAPTRGPFEIEMLEHCGHSPHKDQPEQALARIVRFLEPLG